MIARFISLFLVISALVYGEKNYLGSEWVIEIERDYHNGVENGFVKEINEAYSTAIETENDKMNTQETRAFLQESLKKKINDSSFAKIKALVDERDRQLLMIAEKNPNEFISKIIIENDQINKQLENSKDFKDLLTNALTQKKDKENSQKQDWEFVREFLIKYQITGDRYLRHKNDLEELNKYFVVLALEQLNNLSKANLTAEQKAEPTRFFNEVILKRKMAHNLGYIKKLSVGKQSPANEVEAQVAKVFKDFWEKRKPEPVATKK